MSGTFQKNGASFFAAVCSGRQSIKVPCALMWILNGLQGKFQLVSPLDSPYRPSVFIAILYSFFLFYGDLPGQHLSWQQFSINDGLPSNEVSCLLQDRRGIIWAATYQGIRYYNGYRFLPPIDTSVLVASSALNLWEDISGQVWFSRLPNTLWRVENDTVHPWQYNSKLIAYQKGFGFIGAFALDKSGQMRVAIDKAGYLELSQGGEQKALRLNVPNWSFSEVNGRMLAVQIPSTQDIGPGNKRARNDNSPEVFYWQGDKPISLGHFPLTNVGKGISFRAWRLRNGDFLLCQEQTFYLVHDHKLVWYGQKDVYVEDVFQDIDGAILLCSIAEGTSGLLRYPSIAHFMQDQFENLLPGHEVMSLLCDRQAGWWVSTRDAGIFYCKNPHLDLFDTTDGLPSSNVLRLSSDGQNVFAGFRPFNICSVPIQGGPVKMLPYPPGTSFKELTALCFDTLTSRLWCGADLSFWDNKRWTFSEKKPRLSGMPEKSISAQYIKPDPAGKLFWISYRQDFAAVDRRTGLVETYFQSKDRLFSVTPDPGGFLWVTMLDSLRIWRNGAFERPPFDHPALRYPLRDLDLLPAAAGGGSIIRLKGGGLLIRNGKGEFTHLTTHDGLLSNVFNSLYIAADGTIFACSNAGLDKLTFQSGGTWRIEAITTKNGLPSNQVNDVAVIGQEIWVATNLGLARFRTPPEAPPMLPPLMEFFEVNNRKLSYQQDLKLLHYQNNITFQFFTPPIISEHNIKYQYRLLPVNQEFAITENRQVNFISLQPGAYTFEVQAQNEAGQWSEPSAWKFEICPPWWATWWFRLLLAAFLTLAVWLFVQYRLQTVRAEAAMQQKIKDLQTTALRAQMNPHFIFNCLASIQHFIAENDAKSATRYLARFARLVRLALHGSLDGTHSLAEELEMLDAYMTLEQLRFRGRFSFEINIAEGLPTRDIQLPPMLAQPFVENAIIHGMKNKADGGKIELNFSLEGSNLLVMITDNGPGIKATQTIKNSLLENEHKSVGMSITQNRLELLSGDSKTKHFYQETIFDAEGEASGTRVTLQIPLQA